MVCNDAMRVQMHSWNLIFNVTRATRNLLVPPALDAVAAVFADRMRKVLMSLNQMIDGYVYGTNIYLRRSFTN